MKLNDILSGQFNAAEWEAKGYQLPKFDIAKVREKLSDGVTEYDDVDSAEQHMEEEKAAMPVHEPVEPIDDDDDDLIYPTEDEG